MKLEIACHTCDWLVQMPELGMGQRARCPRCETVIAELNKYSFQNGMALSSAALVFFASTFFYPMLGFRVQGQERSMTLLDSGIALMSNNESLLGSLVLLLIIALPALLLVMLLVLLIGLLLKVRTPLLFWLGRGFYFLREWNMVEVYIVGMIVSLTKIASMATVELGIAFWSLLAFGLCFVGAIYSVDRHHIWRIIRELNLR